MANLSSKSMGVFVDNASGTLTDISGYVNSQSLATAITVLEDTGMGDIGQTSVLGLENLVTLSLSGWVNSTVDGIFGPVAVNNTSVTKTAQFKMSTALYYNGEFWPNSYEVSGTPDTLQTWSVELTSQNSNAINRTSKALA